MRRSSTLVAAVVLCSLITAGTAHACSCSWEGPFLKVAPGSLLVVRGTVIRHHTDDAPCMDFLVSDVLQGGLLDSGMRIGMGDGMLCRPPLEAFPAGSEWVLALDGPGSKPGNGHALSHCGEYWLRVADGKVSGSIDGGEGDHQEMSWTTFLNRFRYPVFKESFQGRARRGTEYRRPFGGRFALVLSPMDKGWTIRVQEVGREEDLARLTPPLHFVPNPREIEGWQFLDDPAACPDRPHNAEAGPRDPREFIFSPEVGKSIQGPDSHVSPTPEDIEAVRRFGRGKLSIVKHVLADDGGVCPALEEITFTVELEGGYGK